MSKPGRLHLMSRVDVVIPCYKYAHYLETAVQSVTSQRDTAVRVLIVDDMSPDDTPRVAQQLTHADDRVAYTRNEKNLGLIGSANKAIREWVRSDYLVLLSADDALAPGSLARATALFEANPAINLVYGAALLFDRDPPPKVGDARNGESQVIDGRRFLRYNFESGNPAPSPAVVVRTQEQLRLGGYNPALKHTSDMEMWMRFAAHGPIGVIRNIQAFYRLHDANMSDAFMAQALRDRQEIIDACETVVLEQLQHDREVRGWLLALKARFADEAFWLAGVALETGEASSLQQRLAFAQAHHPTPWLSRANWRFRLKQALGPNLTRALRKAAPSARSTPGTIAHAYQTRSGLVGWWPQ